MNDLKTYIKLESEGWEHIQNCHRDNADDIVTDLMFSTADYDYTIGMPGPALKYSSGQLKLQSMVGIYRRGGRPVMSILNSPSSSPSFLEPTPKPQSIPTHLDHTIGDKPKEPAYCAASSR